MVSLGVVQILGVLTWRKIISPPSSCTHSNRQDSNGTQQVVHAGTQYGNISSLSRKLLQLHLIPLWQWAFATAGVQRCNAASKLNLQGSCTNFKPTHHPSSNLPNRNPGIPRNPTWLGGTPQTLSSTSKLTYCTVQYSKVGSQTSNKPSTLKSTKSTLLLTSYLPHPKIYQKSPRIVAIDLIRSAVPVSALLQSAKLKAVINIKVYEISLKMNILIRNR